MAKGDDFLEQLWTEAIDVKANHKWVVKCLNRREELANGPFEPARTSLLRLLEQSVAASDLERLAAFARYETCFGVLVALDDPGLGRGRIAGLHRDFLRSHPKTKPRNQREAFIQWLWETESFLDDDGKWLKDLTANELRVKPFRRMFGAVQKILEKAKRVSDVGRVLGWNRYEACSITLRLLEEAGFERGTEPLHLHESLESSYPVDTKPRRTSGAAPDPTVPLWKIRSAQALAFSPDSRRLAVAGASSPVRLYDLATGEEQLACEGIRVHIFRIVFSPDGKQVTAGQIHRELSICDAKTGKLLHKLKRSDDEISGLEHAPSGELICSSWCGEIAVFDSKTGQALPPLTVGKKDDMVDAIALLGNGERLAVICNDTASIWSLPGRKLLRPLNVGGGDIASSRDGKLLAISERNKGVHLLNPANGRRVGMIGVKDLYQGLAFTPDGHHLLVNLHSQKQLSIRNLKKNREVCRLCPGVGICEVQVSPNGEFAAAASERGAFVWRLKPILNQ